MRGLFSERLIGGLTGCRRTIGQGVEMFVNPCLL